MEEYNKDLISFCQESQDLFDSTSGMLFGPSFAEKASEHLKQIRPSAKPEEPTRLVRVFQGPPRAMLSGGASPIPCNDGSHTPKEYREEEDYNKRND